MDKVAFHNWLKKPEEITANDQRFLQEAAQRYPYAAVIQMLYLKSLQADKNYLYQPQLKRTSFLHGDRKLLYGFLQTNTISGKDNEKGADSLQKQVALQQERATKTAIETTENKKAASPYDKGQPYISGERQNQPSNSIDALEIENNEKETLAFSEEMSNESTESVANVEAKKASKESQNILNSEKTNISKEDKDLAPAAGRTATTISPSGEVSIDLDRLDPRTRAVIERSLALRKKIKEDKAEDQQSAPPEQFVENDNTPKVYTALESNNSSVEPLEETRSDEATIEKEQGNAAVAADEVEEKSLETDATHEARAEEEIVKNEQDRAVASTLGFDIEEENEETQVPKAANTIPKKETAKSATDRVENIEVSPDEQLEGEEAISLFGKTTLLEFSADEIEHTDTDLENREFATVEHDFSKVSETSPRKDEEKSKGSEPHSFEEWLELANSGLQLQSATAPVVEKIKLIDAFIEKVPELKPKKEDFNKRGLNVAALTLRGEESFMTETLANIYVQQKHFDKAIGAFEILALKYPEKSSFFADRIEEVTKLKNFNK